MTTTTTDYQETRAALFRASQLLEQARAELASAEAFAETGTSGRMRDDVLGECKLAREATWIAQYHTGSATNTTNRPRR